MFASVWEAETGSTDLKLSHEYFKSRMPVRSTVYCIYYTVYTAVYRPGMRLNKKVI